MDKLTPEERDALDDGAPWRRTVGGWIVCDPSLDEEIEAIPAALHIAIHAGRNVTRAQVERAQALAREAAEEAETIPLMGTSFPPEPEQ